MNLFNGVFSKSSAFYKVQADSSVEGQHRHRRSMDLSSNLHSSSSNPSLEERSRYMMSSERNSSSSERDISMNSENAVSLDRAAGMSNCRVNANGSFMIKPKPVKPKSNSNFGFLSN